MPVGYNVATRLMILVGRVPENSDNDSLVTVNGNAGVMTSTEPYSLVLLGSGLLVVCFAQLSVDA
jgi:hypothetical protein